MKLSFVLLFYSRLPNVTEKALTFFYITLIHFLLVRGILIIVHFLS